MRDRAVNRFGNVECRHPIGPSNGAVESAQCVRHVVARQLTVARAKFFRRLRHPQSCENRTGRICLVVTPPWRRLCIRTWSLRVVRHHFEAQSRLMLQGEERDKLTQTDGLSTMGGPKCVIIAFTT
jgi:hypothetical protein